MKNYFGEKLIDYTVEKKLRLQGWKVKYSQASVKGHFNPNPIEHAKED